MLAGDFFAGPLDTTDATPTQNDQFTPATGTTAARAGTSAAGDAALAAYLDAQYQAGAVGGTSFTFLRYSPDFVTNPGTSTSGTLGYPIAAQETGTTRAVLTITTGVPEPTSAAALGLAGVGLLARRRRARRRDRSAQPARSGSRRPTERNANGPAVLFAFAGGSFSGDRPRPGRARYPRCSIGPTFRPNGPA